MMIYRVGVRGRDRMTDAAQKLRSRWVPEGGNLRDDALEEVSNYVKVV